MSEGKRRVDWMRFEADFATKGKSPPALPTLGIAADKCPCCEERRVLIAAIDEHGHEICVAIGMELAPKALEAFAAAVAENLSAAEKH